ncbi:hypothetical protein QJS10_CPA01g02410 [Acorus calamus]|uniref:Uncharacterized protein n=1 Tax=Acorus calamus TaxID=4465 RepID=A0AAV9FJR7_ACOCL|nr:hypothetical protein QJS10_CPA01g02410 [Acorus calamus]
MDNATLSRPTSIASRLQAASGTPQQNLSQASSGTGAGIGNVIQNSTKESHPASTVIPKALETTQKAVQDPTLIVDLTPAGPESCPIGVHCSTSEVVVDSQVQGKAVVGNTLVEPLIAHDQASFDMTQRTLQENANTRKVLPVEHMITENSFNLLKLFSDSGMHDQPGGELVVVLHQTSLRPSAAFEASPNLTFGHVNTSFASLEADKEKKKKKTREKK